MQMLKHLHWLFIALYLIFYLVKCYLFLAGNTNTFASWRKKTLIPENLFAVGFLATGILMLVQYGTSWLSASPWMHAKITLVIIAIPLGIVGFKKENKVLVFLSATLFIAVLAMALNYGTSNIL